MAICVRIFSKLSFSTHPPYQIHAHMLFSLQRGAQQATDKVVEVLESISRPIQSKEEVAQVGTISANGERGDW